MVGLFLNVTGERSDTICGTRKTKDILNRLPQKSQLFNYLNRNISCNINSYCLEPMASDTRFLVTWLTSCEMDKGLENIGLEDRRDSCWTFATQGIDSCPSYHEQIPASNF